MLNDMQVPFEINPRMVRGLDYYTKTTFEFVHDGLGAQSGIGGGGRYDGLMAQLGGQDLSGIGFGLGVDRTVLALEAEGKTIPGVEERASVFGVALGEEAKKEMVLIINKLRQAGISSDMSYGDRGLKGGCSADLLAHRLRWYWDQELANGTVALKDLAAHEQEDVAWDIVEVLAEKLHG